jgi:DNA-binding winged helix-turn-helix (wHTH) protein
MRDKNEIRGCIKAIKKLLKDERMNNPVNSSIKNGYKMSIDILKRRSTTHAGIGIEDLNTIQARAIAMLAIDYVNGDIADYVLLNIPLKD